MKVELVNIGTAAAGAIGVLLLGAYPVSAVNLERWDSTPQKRYEALLGVQSAKYSSDALERCDKASATASAIVKASFVAPSTEAVPWGVALKRARALANTSPAAPARNEALGGLAAQLAALVRDSIDDHMTAEQVTSAGDEIELALQAFEHKLIPHLVDLETVTDVIIDAGPRPQQVYEAELTRTLLSSAWLALSRARSEGGWDVPKPLLADVQRLSKARDNASRAQSLVSPWCQVEQFALAYLEVQDVGYAAALQSQHLTIREGGIVSTDLKILLEFRRRAGRVIEARMDMRSAGIAQRLQLFRERIARWTAQLESSLQTK